MSFDDAEAEVWEHFDDADLQGVLDILPERGASGSDMPGFALHDTNDDRQLARTSEGSSTTRVSRIAN